MVLAVSHVHQVDPLRTSLLKRIDYMGLEVHDVGARGALLYGFPQTARVNWETAYFSMGITNPSLLEPGMVITVEPGV